MSLEFPTARYERTGADPDKIHRIQHWFDGLTEPEQASLIARIEPMSDYELAADIDQRANELEDAPHAPSAGEDEDPVTPDALAPSGFIGREAEIPAPEPESSADPAAGVEPDSTPGDE